MTLFIVFPVTKNNILHIQLQKTPNVLKIQSVIRRQVLVAEELNLQYFRI